MSDLAGRTASDLAASVRSGDVSPVEVVRAHVERIEAIDEAIGAFEHLRASAALEEADALARRDDLSELPLAGVPVAVKDNLPVEGEPMRSGSAATLGTVQPKDHEIVRRLRAAGAIVVGISRMPELGVYGTSGSATGVVRNPWDPTRTAGGSSGGSAAAVASAMVPLAHGNDGLGSIRIASAACGVFGIKPGSGTVPRDVGVHGWFGMVENGPLATTVEDAALALSVMAERPDLADIPKVDVALRVAVSLDTPLPGLKIDPTVRDATLATADALGVAGHEIAFTGPKVRTGDANAAMFRWFAAVHDEIEGLDIERLQRRTLWHARAGWVVARLHLVREAQRQRWRATTEAFFRDHDLLITPTVTGPPPVEDGWQRRGFLANVISNVRWAPFLGGWNLAGYPAASVPAGMHPSGTPIGVQLVGKPGSESILLAVARFLQEQRPWPRHASV
jgi:amidase